MRTDVKLGVVIALATVLVAGGYYMDGDSAEKPVEMTKKSLADAAKPAAEQKASRRTASSPARPKVAAKQRHARSPQGKASPGKTRSGATAQRQTSAKPSIPPTSAHTRAPQQNKNRAGQAASSKTAKTKPAGASTASPPAKSTRPGATSTTRTHPAGAGSQPARKLGNTVPAAASRSSNRPGATDARQVNTSKQVAKTSGTPAGPRTADASKRRNPSRRGAGLPNPHDDAQGSALARRGAATAKRRNPATPATKVNHRSVAVDTHRVQQGDSLAALAKMYYGSEKHVSFLLKSNPKITDPRRLALGTVVRIPPLPMGEPANKPTSARALRASTRGGHGPIGSARTYTVKAGDTFYGIAGRKLGNAGRWRSLYELNAKLVGDDPSRLKIGQVLKLPPK